MQSASSRPATPDRRSGASCIVHSAFLVFLVALLPSVLGAEVIDRVLAVVSGVIITQSDVTAAFDLGLVTVEQVDDPIGAALARLIDRQLILAEVDRYAPPEPTVEAVDRELQAVRAKFPSVSVYESILLRTGIDENHLRQTLRDDLRIRAYVEQRFAVPARSDDELIQYYREHSQAFTRGGQVLSFEAARPEITRLLAADRRAPLVQEWVSGLRRRASITRSVRPETLTGP
jgi:hypothetical protein